MDNGSNNGYYLSEVVELINGNTNITQEYIRNNPGNFPVYSSSINNNGHVGSINSYDFDGEYITITKDGNVGDIFYRNNKFSVSSSIILNIIKNSVLLTKYLYYYLLFNQNKIKQMANSSSTINHLYIRDLKKIKIFLPSVHIQQKIIDIIEPIEKIYLFNIRLNDRILKLIKSHYKIGRRTNVLIKEVAFIEIGGTPSTSNDLYWVNGKINWINSRKLTNTLINIDSTKKITTSALNKTRLASDGDLLFSIIEPSVNKISFSDGTNAFNQSIARVYNSPKKLYLEIMDAMTYFQKIKNGAAQQTINKKTIENTKILLSSFNYDIFYKMITIVAKINKKINKIKNKIIKLLIK